MLAAIASPRRREILRLVWSEELAAGAIHRAMPDVTFGAVSLQLRRWSTPGSSNRDPRAGTVSIARGATRSGPSARMLEGMWGDALWRLKLQAELLRHAAAPGRSAPTHGWRQPGRENSNRHAISRIASIGRSSSRRRRRPCSASSPRASAGRRGGARAPRSSRRAADASTSAMPTASRARARWSRSSRRRGSSSPRLQQRQPHSAGQLARHDQPGAAGARHAARSAPRVRRGRLRATSTSRAGAISCRSSATWSRTSSTLDAADSHRRMVRRLVGNERGHAADRRSRRSPAPTSVPRPLQPARRARRSRPSHRRDTTLHARPAPATAGRHPALPGNAPRRLGRRRDRRKRARQRHERLRASGR